MIKQSASEHLTEKEKRAAVEAALAGGMEPAEIFKAILQNVYGTNERKSLLLKWGERMGLDASESLRIAQSANLIRSSRKPSGPSAEKPQRKTPGKTGG
jgi:hypothetical protein